MTRPPDATDLTRRGARVSSDEADGILAGAEAA